MIELIIYKIPLENIQMKKIVVLGLIGALANAATETIVTPVTTKAASDCKEENVLIHVHPQKKN